MSFVVSACAGELVRGSPTSEFNRVCTDSRQARAGDLFVALKGQQHDGHDYLAQVAKSGVAAVLVERGRVPNRLPGCAVIAVGNPRQALGRLAAAYRRDFALPVVAVGGSNGKTTTKELVASVLRQKLPVLWSEASFNNDIGVPLTVLRLENAHQAAVLEVGTNHPDELAPLVKLAQPKFGVVTNLAREHLEFFGDMNGVVEEEGWLAELLPAGGKLFLNGDSQWAEAVARRTRATVVRAGLAEANDWRARSLRPDTKGVAFRVDAPRAEFSGDYRVNLLGRHQVVNALFAVMVGVELGLGRPEIRDGLAQCPALNMRMQLWQFNGVRVLDDAYNANADSMRAALQTLHDFQCRGRRVAGLGDMAELGAHSEAAHAEVGQCAAESGVGQLFTVGRMAAVIAQAARDAGLNRVIEFSDAESAAAAVRSFVKEGDVILLKASRATHLERVAEFLRAGAPARKS